MNKWILGLFLIGLMVLSACRKDDPDNDRKIERTIDLRVPAGFTYANNKELGFRISISDERFGALGHRITFYEGNPTEGGLPIAIGAATVNRPFVGKLELSNTHGSIYISRRSPDGSETVRQVQVIGQMIEMDFSDLNAVSVSSRNLTIDCNLGCTNTLNNHNGNINVSSGITCLTGSFNGNITVGGNGIVRICGNAVVGSLNMNGANGQIQIASSANAQINGWGNVNGQLLNAGTVSFQSGANVGSGGLIINDGTMQVVESFNINNRLENHGTLNIGGTATLNTTGTIENYCNITVNANLNLNGQVDNLGYIRSTTQMNLQGNPVLNLHNAAMLSATNIVVNKPLIGLGATSFVKVSSNTTINSNGSLQGQIQFCDLNGVEVNNGTIGPNVSFACDLYIPSGSCNPEGNGSAPGDSDGDNIPDDLDDFPDDPNAAFAVFYPAEVEGHTLLFEDLWPAYGDYDFNDLVVGFRYQLITNGNNQVIRFRAIYELRAAGAGNPLGFGVEFPFPRSNVAEVSGGTLEEGQLNAVVILFENAKEHMRVFNTIPSNPIQDPVFFLLEVSLVNPIPLSSMGLGTYNPFIWNVDAASGRGHEIHLPGKPPTAKADFSLFGTAKDNSNPGANQFYVSKDNYPWALHIPGRFDYPIEKADIVTAYLKFAEWVESAGATNQDWFLKKPGHVDPNKIYTKE